MKDDEIPVSSAMRSVLWLSVLYFSFYGLLAFVKSWSELLHGGRKTNFQLMAEAAVFTMDYIPMTAVLFMSLRMRGLEQGMEEPPSYARSTMNMLVYLMYIQA